jgi:hypothetical protein
MLVENMLQGDPQATRGVPELPEMPYNRQSEGMKYLVQKVFK